MTDVLEFSGCKRRIRIFLCDPLEQSTKSWVASARLHNHGQAQEFLVPLIQP